MYSNYPPLYFSPLKRTEEVFKLKLEKVCRWVGKDFFDVANPHPCRITDVTKTEKDLLLFLKSELSGEISQMSLWGQNKNGLIDKFGSETETWRGKLVKVASTIAPDGKNLKELQPI